MKFWKSILRSRLGLACFGIALSVLFSVLFGAVFSLIVGTFWGWTKTMFWCFFAPGVVGALLLVLTPIEEGKAIGFGYGLYYGSMFAITIFSKIGASALPYVAGISLTVAVCYAVYLKFF